MSFRAPRSCSRSEARGTQIAPVVTNETGDFVVPNVTADTYTVEVTMPSFKTLLRKGVPVSGGDRVALGRARARSRRRAGNRQRHRRGAAPAGAERRALVRHRVTSRSKTFRSRTANFASLASLAPGVSGTNRIGGGGQTNFVMDGVSVVDTGNNSQMLQLNVEAIAEVKVLTVQLSGRVRALERSADHRRDQERHEPIPRLGLRREAQLRLEHEQLGQRARTATPRPC